MKILAFDIETGSADELHSYGPGYVRLCGAKYPGEQVRITADADEFMGWLIEAPALTATNGLNFDALAMAKYHGDHLYEQLCAKMWDTMTVERHLNPVAAKGMQRTGYYGLDQMAARYGVAGKSTVDFDGKREIIRRIQGDAAANKLKRGKEDSFGVLKLLAALYGGFDRIPQDDPDYRLYLEHDVNAQMGVFQKQSALVADLSSGDRAYIRREHRVAAAMGRVTLNGFRVDTDLTMSRYAAGQARLEAHKQMLHEQHGMPLEGKFPHRSNLGKAAFRRALLATGISEQALDANWPLGKDGSLLTGKEVLDSMIAVFDRTKPAAAELCRVIKAYNGERSVYGTMLQHVVNGRVHPYIGPDQSSGRWSMKDPGLTVLGKRGGKAVERAALLADEGEVLCAIDADQIDARMIAIMSQDPEYMKLFVPGVDLHSEVALRVFNRPECREEMARNNGRCDCEYRERAKVFGHGFNYGMGANGMAKQHGVDPAVAKRFVDGMTEAFPRLAAWKEEVRQAAGCLGFDKQPPPDDTYRILHTAFGRPVRVERNRAYTQACAQLGQGSTRDAMAEAILNLPPATRRRIKAVIHDEIVLSLPAEGAQEAAQAIADGMGFDMGGLRIGFGCSRVSPTWAGTYGEQYETAA